MACNHTKFEAYVEVSGGRSSTQATDRRSVTVQVRCTECGLPLRFEENIGIDGEGRVALLHTLPLGQPQAGPQPPSATPQGQGHPLPPAATTPPPPPPQ